MISLLGMINLSYNRSSTLKNSIEVLENLRNKILLAPIPAKVELRLRWEATIDRVYWSINLSGSSLSKKEMVKILTEPKRGKLSSEEQEVVNYKKALDYIWLNWLVSKKSVTISTILTLHEIATRQTFGRSLGNLFRLNEGILRQVLEYIQIGNEHPIIQAGIAFSQLISISPFTNGNGRVGRLLALLFLYKHGYDFRGFLTIEEFFTRDRKPFDENIKKVTKSKNLTIWLEYFASIVVRSLEKAEKDIASQHSYLDLPSSFWQLNDRQKNILAFFEQPDITITNRKVQKLFKVSQITASRDLARLATLGLVFPHGKGRSVYYTRA